MEGINQEMDRNQLGLVYYEDKSKLFVGRRHEMMMIVALVSITEVQVSTCTYMK